ncbi:uncharacterized protein FPRO_03552 [Fusarium proliferatum ET1]|uniref:Uncharacterized protein n=1 Tax=Fusarium proliferatum (strain ET1) TaxID=1227346 RepID=A0A1L7V5S5_FUSPR|nr:uncharacterized protein FPRO_03552 [Fusarium proliferatum ET1]CZR36188.1 uncharacterized protein FPRO_03552 [Fusarium proliferatum ET1]
MSESLCLILFLCLALLLSFSVTLLTTFNITHVLPWSVICKWY